MKLIIVTSIFLLLILGCSDESTLSSSNNSAREVYGIQIKKATIIEKEITLSVDCVVPDPSYGYSHMDVMIAGKTIFLRVFTKPISTNGAVQVLWSFKEDIKITVPSSGEYTVHYRYGYEVMRDTALTVQ